MKTLKWILGICLMAGCIQSVDAGWKQARFVEKKMEWPARLPDINKVLGTPTPIDVIGNGKGYRWTYENREGENEQVTAIIGTGGILLAVVEPVTFTKLECPEALMDLPVDQLKEQYLLMRRGNMVLPPNQEGTVYLASWTKEALEPLVERIAEQQYAINQARRAEKESRTFFGGDFEVYYEEPDAGWVKGYIKNLGLVSHRNVLVRVDFLGAGGAVMDSTVITMVDRLPLHPDESRQWRLPYHYEGALRFSLIE